MKKIIITSIAAAVLVGCATAPQDLNRMKNNVEMAGAGEDGVCVMAVHRAAVNIDIANEMLALAKTDGLNNDEYTRGMAASEAAVSARAVLQEACTVRSSILALGLSAVYAQTLKIPGINFEQDSAELTAEAKPILEAIASRLVKENTRVEIAGHTSNTGDEAHNLKLSQSRAEVVVAYLKSLGVPEANMVAKGYGMSQPVADNSTQDGRNANKRVELRYIK
jgi:outer membrane protein OmpA-like peptidoglycan-associated protein